MFVCVRDSERDRERVCVRESECMYVYVREFSITSAPPWPSAKISSSHTFQAGVGVFRVCSSYGIIVEASAPLANRSPQCIRRERAWRRRGWKKRGREREMEGGYTRGVPQTGVRELTRHPVARDAVVGGDGVAIRGHPVSFVDSLETTKTSLVTPLYTHAFLSLSEYDVRGVSSECAALRRRRICLRP